MRRENGKIYLTEREVWCLFKKLFDAPIPDNETLEDAAMACVFYIGVEAVDNYLLECRKEGTL